MNSGIIGHVVGVHTHADERFCFVLLISFRRICICRIFVYKGFLSDAECDHLVTLVSHRAPPPPPVIYQWVLFAVQGLNF